MKILAILLLSFGIAAIIAAFLLARWSLRIFLPGPDEETLGIHRHRRQHPKCFISFHREDHALAQRIADHLVIEGFEAKLVFDPERLPEDLIREIVPSIQVSAFLIHVNPDRRTSRWIDAELALADYWKVRIVPVKDLPALEIILPDLLRSYPSIDYTARKRHIFEQPMFEMTNLLEKFIAPDDPSAEQPDRRYIDGDTIYDSDGLSIERAREQGHDSMPGIVLLAVMLAILLGATGLISVIAGLILLIVRSFL